MVVGSPARQQSHPDEMTNDVGLDHIVRKYGQASATPPIFYRVEELPPKRIRGRIFL
jgi:hypothetical protein